MSGAGKKFNLYYDQGLTGRDKCTTFLFSFLKWHHVTDYTWFSLHLSSRWPPNGETVSNGMRSQWPTVVVEKLSIAGTLIDRPQPLFFLQVHCDELMFSVMTFTAQQIFVYITFNTLHLQTFVRVIICAQDLHMCLIQSVAVSVGSSSSLWVYHNSKVWLINPSQPLAPREKYGKGRYLCSRG